MEPQSVKQTICGKLPINLVKVNNVAPTTVLVPSEMGLPILIEVSMPSVISTEGYVTVECSKPLPSIELSLTIKPFAVIKPVVAIDLIPLPVHPSVKIIKSEGERRTIEHTFGETVGLNLKYLIKTEADVTDLKTVVDVISLYKYNPLNTLIFGWTASPMTVGGYPTTRYSEYKIIYLPTRSATKEMETEVALGAVYKKHSYVIEYKPESLGVIAPKQVLEKLNVESGVAVSAEMKVILKGVSPKKYSFPLIGGHGFTGMVQKWKLHLENTERTKICIDGKLTMPSVSLRNTHELKSQDIKMFLKNVIGFGKTCEAST